MHTYISRNHAMRSRRLFLPTPVSQLHRQGASAPRIGIPGVQCEGEPEQRSSSAAIHPQVNTHWWLVPFITPLVLAVRYVPLKDASRVATSGCGASDQRAEIPSSTINLSLGIATLLFLPPVSSTSRPALPRSIRENPGPNSTAGHHPWKVISHLDPAGHTDKRTMHPSTTAPPFASQARHGRRGWCWPG